MLREQIEKNYFVNDIVRRTVFKKQNDMVLAVTDKMAQIDSIESFDEFKDAVAQIKYFNGTIFSVKRAFGESLHYGHLQALKEYAGFNEDDFKYFPVLEHGVNFWEHTEIVPLPRVCQGTYLIEKWRKRHPYVPIYSIGPYITYAKEYYDKSRFCELKARLKKTVLIFPAHTFEMDSQEYDMKKFVDETMNRFSSDYDTVMISAYWADLRYELYDLFAKAGAKIVSAGFRGDPNFISRLKTMILLSDYIVGNDLGTFVGYGKMLGKPVSLIHTDINRVSAERTNDYKTFTGNISLFYEYFAIDKPIDEQKQHELCCRFWG